MGKGKPGLFEVFVQEMRLRNYSYKTIKAYKSCLRSFVRFLEPRHPREVSDADIRAYLIHLVEECGFEASSINQTINALRFLYCELYKRPMVLGDIPRPKKEKKLPVVLSVEEVGRILSATENLKHHLILTVIYSAGLRVGEVVRLRIEDLDWERKLLRVRAGKGKKDRYTLLASSIAVEVKEYVSRYRPREWLFEGQIPGHAYAIRSAQRVFELAVKAAGIQKKVTIHSLRHAFATHLLEQGTDIRVIQGLLGHASVKTTEIYTHVSNQTLALVRNPIEGILERQQRNKTD